MHYIVRLTIALTSHMINACIILRAINRKESSITETYDGVGSYEKFLFEKYNPDVYKKCYPNHVSIGNDECEYMLDFMKIAYGE